MHEAFSSVQIEQSSLKWREKRNEAMQKLSKTHDYESRIIIELLLILLSVDHLLLFSALMAESHVSS